MKNKRDWQGNLRASNYRTIYRTEIAEGNKHTAKHTAREYRGRFMFYVWKEMRQIRALMRADIDLQIRAHTSNPLTGLSGILGGGYDILILDDVDKQLTYLNVPTIPSYVHDLLNNLEPPKGLPNTADHHNTIENTEDS